LFYFELAHDIWGGGIDRNFKAGLMKQENLGEKNPETSSGFLTLI
jgi:hypothetical protein